MAFPVKILHAEFITHDVKRFTVERPDKFAFEPGQATDLSVQLPGWTEQLRPFTFTCLADAENLEFIIKIYPERKGVTDQLGRLNGGDGIILHDVFGTIQYQGPGVFLAGGAGVTPFISIFRTLQEKHQLPGHTLICSHKTEDDIILKEEFTKMLGDEFKPVLTRGQTIGFRDKHIDRDFLVSAVSDFGQHFYVCGPDEFVRDINALLLELGAESQSLVFEK